MQIPSRWRRIVRPSLTNGSSRLRAALVMNRSISLGNRAFEEVRRGYWLELRGLADRDEIHRHRASRAATSIQPASEAEASACGRCGDEPAVLCLIVQMRLRGAW